ncbi:MAG: zinc ribbon domain-containing protein [Kiritimatiellae bacterium]|jgi:putative FmdB family regulatory protein|nr:zinc ribbon domain-containing protein [Kiritimatiellia bacterium]
MPTYVYEAQEPAKGCTRCAQGFEIVQSINDPHLTRCPDCGAAVYRVMQPPGLGHSKTDLHYRAKRAGFHSMKRIGKGEYEKMY